MMGSCVPAFAQNEKKFGRKAISEEEAIGLPIWLEMDARAEEVREEAQRKESDAALAVAGEQNAEAAQKAKQDLEDAELKETAEKQQARQETAAAVAE